MDFFRRVNRIDENRPKPKGSRVYSAAFSSSIFLTSRRSSFLTATMTPFFSSGVKKLLSEHEIASYLLSFPSVTFGKL
jgi:hypothetical protein